MGNISISVYLPDADHEVYLRYKEILNIAARDCLKKKLEEIKKEDNDANK